MADPSNEPFTNPIEPGCEPGLYVSESGVKLIVWYDKRGVMHVNGMGAIISPEEP